MHISKITIKNFKCIKDSTFYFDPHFNLIIGKNNGGKSTIFEAMRLWQLAFVKFLKDRTNNQESSFYSTQYFSFTIEDLSFLRISDFKRLFNTSGKKKFFIQLTLSENENTIDLPIHFTLTTEALNLRFELFEGKNQKNVSEKRKGASKTINNMLGKPQGTSLKNLLLITYINPIFQLPTLESCYTKGYIVNSLHQAKVDSVLRNILHLYAPDEHQTTVKRHQNKNEQIKKIEQDLNNILFGANNNLLSFTSAFKKEEDVYISLFAHNKDDNSKVELSQLGSGTINLLNILSVLAFGDANRYIMNILLLDEPDSHLHSNHQVKLFEYLKKVSNDSNKQMFVITHNHELISNAEEVLYVGNNHTNEIKPINQDAYIKIIEDLASDSEYYRVLVEKNNVAKQLHEITKPTLFCEGSTDVTILKTAFEKLYNSDYDTDLVEHLEIKDGNSAAGVAERIKNANQDIITIGLFDSDKAGIDQYNGFKNGGIVKSKICDFCTRLDQKDNNNVPVRETKRYIMKLPIPEFRRDEADWFNDNTFIEYMFTNEALRKMEVVLEQQKGNTYKTIVGKDNAKKNIQYNVKNLTQDDFASFKHLFEKIFEIINYNVE